MNLTTMLTRSLRTAAYAAAVPLLLACGSRAGSINADSSAAAEPAGGAITLWTDSTELFMEHPALVVGAPGKFAVHLTDLTDFAPLRSGRITLRFVPRTSSAAVVVVQEAPRSPGIYGPSPAFTNPGVYDLTIVVESPQARDSITVPDLRVYASAAEAPKEDGASEDGIPFLKEQQWKTDGFRTEFAVSGEVAESFAASGEIQSAAGRLAEVAAPIAGLIDAASVASSPVPGQRVTRGQVLAYLRPSIGDGGSAFTDARATLREAEDEHARAVRLFAVEAISQRRLHEAENRLRAAREALAGLGAGELAANGMIAVRAPIGGTVAERHIVPGTRVDAGTTLFTLVDPSVVWLLVHVPAVNAARIDRASVAEFTIEGSERRYAARRTISVGSVIDSLSRTVPVLYEVANGDGSIRIGAASRAAVRTGGRARGVLIPSSAVLDEDGRAVVYVQADGERFEKRAVSVVGVHGTRTVVSGGITAGERIVTGAAYQVRLASLSTSVPAHGHEH
jgi:cobalt-zinc-cadmium efflux system membrane fusion protein